MALRTAFSLLVAAGQSICRRISLVELRAAHPRALGCSFFFAGRFGQDGAEVSRANSVMDRAPGFRLGIEPDSVGIAVLEIPRCADSKRWRALMLVCSMPACADAWRTATRSSRTLPDGPGQGGPGAGARQGSWGPRDIPACFCVLGG